MKKRLITTLVMICLLVLLIPTAKAEHIHDANYEKSGRCSTCGEYKPNEKCVEYQIALQYKVKKDKTAYLRRYPYAACNEHNGEVVWAINSGRDVVVLGEVTNGVGNKWFHVWFIGEKDKDFKYMNQATYPNGTQYREGYIYSESLEPTLVLRKNLDGTTEHVTMQQFYTFEISNETSPMSIRQGQSFGLRGIIKPTSNGSWFIWGISAYVYDMADPENMKIVPGFEYHKDWDTKRGGDRGVCVSYDIQRDGLDSAFRFGNLTAGDYVYLVRATNVFGPTRVIWAPFVVY